MADKKDQKAYRRKTTRFVIAASAGATLITVAGVVAAVMLGSGMPPWFISLTASGVVAWFAVGVGVVLCGFQRIVSRATAALKKELRAEVAQVADGLRLELRKDLATEAQLREADQWVEALRHQAEDSNVRKIR